jgi:hypothetical protein
MARTGARIPEARGAETTSYARLSDKIDALNAKIEKLTEGKPPDKPMWYTVLVNFIALPAAILAIVIQWGQISSSGGERAKTAAETTKLDIETLKTRAELEKTLDDLSAKRATGVDAYRDALEAAIPKIQKSLSELNILTKVVKPDIGLKIISRFILLWAIFIGISLIFDIFAHVIGAFTSSLYTWVYSRPDISQPWKSAVSYAQPVFLYIPIFFSWYVRWIVFFVLVIPFITELAGYLGFPHVVSDAISSFGRLHFMQAVLALKSIFVSP